MSLRSLGKGVGNLREDRAPDEGLQLEKSPPLEIEVEECLVIDQHFPHFKTKGVPTCVNGSRLSPLD